MIDLLTKLCFGIVMLCFMSVPVKHILHMFQQNRYESGRMLSWICTQFRQGKKPIQTWVISILALLLLFLPDERLRLILTFWLAVGGSILTMLEEARRMKTYIKPLHCTTRVIRQIVVMVLLNLAWLIPAIHCLPSSLWSLIVLVGCGINWGLIFVMAWLSEPIERGIKRYYMHLAKQILRSYPARIIGITGSYGKTSCKNILQGVLSERYYSLMTPASFNTPMGITITIRTMLKPLHEVFVCEMGADHVGDIETLMKFVQPQYGIVTSIGPQHLQTFKTMENIVHEKMKMIEMLPANGVGVLNRDNEWIRNTPIRNSCKILWYGIEQQDVDYRAIHLRYSRTGSCFTVVDRKGQQTEFETRLLGEHNIANILAAITLGREMGLTMEQLQQAVAKVPYVEHRLQLKKMNGYTFIDDAFNSNPVGSAMALEVLKRMDGGRRFIVTPGMIDLGEQQKTMNKQFGEKMKGCVDEVILVGEQQTRPIAEGLKNSGFEMEHVHVVKTVKEAFELVWKMASPQDTILLENDLPDAFNQ